MSHHPPLCLSYQYKCKRYQYKCKRQRQNVYDKSIIKMHGFAGWSVSTLITDTKCFSIGAQPCFWLIRTSACQIVYSV